ncbi:hypothetical protein NLJ89_g11091 [Agrocybe chaxingu]|uniref:GRF-type domain-containing protein n=1 Tax=Agrocybe chaxingu TaxID=84603 RepID=A0A9W8JQL2_9AGAR|nr:hypothetical protein NLJ89_g11091 [Agrocybe chaxingu]
MVARGLAEGLEGEDGFWGQEYRRWIRDWLAKEDGTGGCMVDIVRKFWPDRKGMYTCWNTKISARDTNYGTRIDFILITPGLVPWVKAADIQPQMKGSDHCPVFVDLFDEITNADGYTVRLRDVMGSRAADGTPPEPPRLAAKFWDEHKQKLLSNFFGKKTDAHETVPSSSTSSCAQPSQTPSTGSQPPAGNSNSPSPSDVELLDPVSSPPDPSSSTTKRKLTVDHIPSAMKKLKPSQSQKEPSKGKSKLQSKPSQSSIASFFSQPRASKSAGSSVPPSDARGKLKTSTSSSPLPSASETQTNLTEVDEDADYQLALQLSQAETVHAPSTSQEKDPGESKQAWSTLLAPTQIPLCTMHREPAKEYTVNKPGPNKGKKFFICSRPVGPGYDKGSERPRDQVDPRYKCNFFKWSSEVRKEMARNGKP